MRDNMNNDRLETDSEEASFGKYEVQEENDIFQPEEEVHYTPPVEETSVFDQPMYRENAYDSGKQPEAKVSNTETEEEKVQEQPEMTASESEVQRYGSYHFTAQQIHQDHLQSDVSSETQETQTQASADPQSYEQTSQTQTASAYDQYSQKTSQPETKKKRKEKKKGGFGKKLAACVALAAVFGLVSGGVFLGVAKVGGNALGIYKNTPPVIGMVGDDMDVEPGKSDTSAAQLNSGENYSVAQVAERCMPAMVGITNKSIQEVPNYFGFGYQNRESESSGSGIIIGQTETELLIATNNHVVSGANTLTVCFVDDELVHAIIKGTDAENDLAVIAVNISDIKEETLAQVKVIELGDSNELKVGEQVVAIGNALGYGQSVSSGYVSALNREVMIDNTTYTLIQTDAAINPGNSGGALLNMKGELIGINESKYADTAVEGMGYAIPISTATPILSNLMSRETRYKVDEEDAAYLGISCKDISAEFAEMYNVPTGVYVDSIVENGPAAVAGLQKGDIITSFDGTKTASYSDLISLLEYYAADEIIEVVYYRTNNGVYTEQTASVILGARSESELADQDEQTEDTQNNGNSGYFGNQGGGFDIFDFFGY